MHFWPAGWYNGGNPFHKTQKRIHSIEKNTRTQPLHKHVFYGMVQGGYPTIKGNEIWDEEIEIDEDYQGHYEEEETNWEKVPITDEERYEGMEKELAKMDKFKTYKPVPNG